MKTNTVSSSPSKPKLVILATFWNEESWLPLALEQIIQLSPDEICILEGCFDPSQKLHSTDTTLSLLKAFAEKNQMVKIFPAIRAKNRFHAYWLLLRYPFLSFSPSRLWTLFKSTFKSIYRVNQAISFNFLISQSKLWKSDNWFMTYDSDQFYSDAVVETIARRENMNATHGILTAHEYTFLQDLNTVTTAYEKRTWSNMPHKIFSSTVIQPTREIRLESFLFSKSYFNNLKTRPIGNYFHYKFPTPRFHKGYTLGDRVSPQIHDYPHTPLEESHPTIILRNLDYVNRTFFNRFTPDGSKSKKKSKRKKR